MIVLALGSNLGDRQGNLLKAIGLLSDIIVITKQSSIYSTPALLPDNADASWDIDFYNMVIAGKLISGITPQQLLVKIKDIEQQLGRKNRGCWAPREIDIDIIDFNGLIIDKKDLKLPHYAIEQREFVAKPLYEILPNWQNPATGNNITDIVAKLPNDITKITTSIVPILNCTPDSFSDGSDNFLTKAKLLVEQGANIIDIGGESTRPNAAKVTAEQEWQRINPVLNYLADKAHVSIDTYKPEIAHLALQNGAKIINDVNGFKDPYMVDLALQHKCKIIAMHSLTVPADKNIVMPEDCDITQEIIKWGQKKVKELTSKGIKPHNIILDIGIGFGKTTKQSWQLVYDITDIAKAYHNLGVELLVGHSRKSFLQWVTDKPAPERDYETAILSNYLAKSGVDYLRVHNYNLNKKAVFEFYKANS